MTVFLFVVIMDVFAIEFEGLHNIDCLEGFDAVFASGPDHVDQALFKVGTVHDHRVGLTNCRHLLGGRLKIMRICADRHNYLDVHLITDNIADNISKNVRRHNDRGKIRIDGLARYRRFSGPARRCHKCHRKE